MKNQTKTKEKPSGWKETNYLLSNPVNAEHLKQSLEEMKREEGVSVKIKEL